MTPAVGDVVEFRRSLWVVCSAWPARDEYGLLSPVLEVAERVPAAAFVVIPQQRAASSGLDTVSF